MTATVILAAGVAIGGWAAGNGFVRARLGDRFVTVKGILPRDQARGIGEESQVTRTVRVVSTVDFVLR